MTEPILEPFDPDVSDQARGAGRKAPQASVLIRLAEEAELFHDADGKAFADIWVHGHRETWTVDSPRFKDWLTKRFYSEHGRVPSTEAWQGARGAIEAKARFEGPERKVYLRVGEAFGRFFLDLCDDTWRGVEIEANGCWRIVDITAVRFRRTKGMRPLPVPVRGSIDALRRFINLGSDDDFVLAVSFLFACLRPKGPYPVLVLTGEQGSAKSTFSAILRALVDPNLAPLRALPREERELVIAANNGHVLAFDNASHVSPEISDALCRMASGSGFATRQLYTDHEEVLFSGGRPVILNGIEDLLHRPDLADRAITLTLEAIPDDRRRTEAELLADFEAQRPAILGALVDAVATGLKRLPDTKLDRPPRMADFATWATACETAFWPAGTFMAAYAGNRATAVDSVIDSDAVLEAMRAFMAPRDLWEGTATELLRELGVEAGGLIASAKSWPANAKGLSGRLRRGQAPLRAVGIALEFAREGQSRRRVIAITRNRAASGPEMDRGSASSPSAASVARPNGADVSTATDANLRPAPAAMQAMQAQPTRPG